MVAGGAARYRLLGPLRYRTEAGWAAVRAAQPRAVLALLLVEAGRTVSMDRLIDELWGERPPPTARNTVQGYVMRLRRTVGGTLLTRDRGYELAIDDDDLDAAVFERLAGRRPGTPPREALAQLERALALWDGPALCDVPPTPTLTAEAARLEQRRLGTLEHRYRLELGLGRHAEVVHELESLAAEHPLREELRAGAMLALYRCGRRADALAGYRDHRAAMVAELGIEPGPDLRDLHQAILADDPRLRRPGGPADGGTADGAVAGAGPPVPAQLPAAVTGFTGRREHLHRLDALLAPPPGEERQPGAERQPGGERQPEGGRQPGAVTVVAVTGPPGVGKTALVTHWAHRVRDRFPDGQLHVDLRGYASDPPGRPLEALTQFLIALGVPADQVPTDVDAAARLYRSRLAGRRVLVVLDNANHPDQVRPLLPGEPGCLVVVTSRDRLTGLVAGDGALGQRLGVLAADEARALVRVLLGPAYDGEAHHLDRLVELCGCLPLALRIAAANLTGDPHRPLAAYLDRLAGDRLAHLAVDGDPRTTVRAAFDLSYAALTPGARRLFRLLGLVPGPDTDAGAAAALSGGPAGRTVRLLGELCRAHLAEEYRAGRYRLHDLLREYAEDRCRRQDPAPRRAAARHRLYGYYLAGADAAARLVYPDKLRLPVAASAGAGPDPGDPAAALDWLDRERTNLLAVLRAAAATGPSAVGWSLADTLRGYFAIRLRLVDWRTAADLGYACAVADGEPAAQAAARLSLAALHWKAGRYRDAVAAYAETSRLCARAGWRDGAAAATGNLGVVYQELGYLDRAADCYARALRMIEHTGWLPGRANGLGNLAEIYRRTGRLGEAVTAIREAIAIYRSIGSRVGESGSLATLAQLRCDSGRHRLALLLAARAAALARCVGDEHHELEARHVLAAVHHRGGAYAEAARLHHTALQLARAVDSRYPQARALTGLALAAAALADAEGAAGYARDALRVARQAGSVLLEGEALAAAAVVQLGQEHPERALGFAAQALRGFQRTGQRVAEIETHELLARILLRLGRDRQAEAHRTRAAHLARVSEPDPACAVRVRRRAAEPPSR